MVGIDIPMPKCCDDCIFTEDFCICFLTRSELNFNKEDKERLPDCPLVDLQKPPEAIEAEKAIERMRGNLNRIREVLKVLNE